jgi:hypothetical protein
MLHSQKKGEFDAPEMQRLAIIILMTIIGFFVLAALWKQLTP